MNFSTHIKRHLKLINIAIAKDKESLVKDFIDILKNSNELLKTDLFNFWIKQLKEVPLEELPLTFYGKKQALKHLKIKSYNKDLLVNAILSVCECLFTYSSENDLCEFQTEFHYYFHLSSKKVFKESKMGQMVPNINKKAGSEIRIAMRSELVQKDDNDFI